MTLRSDPSKATYEEVQSKAVESNFVYDLIQKHLGKIYGKLKHIWDLEPIEQYRAITQYAPYIAAYNVIGRDEGKKNPKGDLMELLLNQVTFIGETILKYEISNNKIITPETRTFLLEFY